MVLLVLGPAADPATASVGPGRGLGPRRDLGGRPAYPPPVGSLGAGLGVGAGSPGRPPGTGSEVEVAAVADKHEQAEQMRDDVPSTVARSDDKAVRTFAKTLDSAEDSYGSGERARRTAFASLKHTHEKVGDHWEPKDEPGPSDEQAAKSTPESRDGKPTAQGVDANAKKDHLVEVAKKVGVEHPTTLKKAELIKEIEKANARETRKAR